MAGYELELRTFAMQQMSTTSSAETRQEGGLLSLRSDPTTAMRRNGYTELRPAGVIGTYVSSNAPCERGSEKQGKQNI